jgi:hypothetical protein
LGNDKTECEKIFMNDSDTDEPNNKNKVINNDQNDNNDNSLAEFEQIKGLLDKEINNLNNLKERLNNFGNIFLKRKNVRQNIKAQTQLKNDEDLSLTKLQDLLRFKAKLTMENDKQEEKPEHRKLDLKSIQKLLGLDDENSVKPKGSDEQLKLPVVEAQKLLSNAQPTQTPASNENVTTPSDNNASISNKLKSILNGNSNNNIDVPEKAKNTQNKPEMDSLKLSLTEIEKKIAKLRQFGIDN